MSAIPWAELGDEPFRAGVDWKRHAVLSWGPDQRCLYTEGYIRVAGIVGDHVVSTAQDQDLVVFPVAFLNRQNLEILTHVA